MWMLETEYWTSARATSTFTCWASSSTLNVCFSCCCSCILSFSLWWVLAEGQRRCGCSSAVLSGPLCCALSPCVRNWAGFGFAVITFSLPLALNFLNTIFCSLCLDHCTRHCMLFALFVLHHSPSSSLRTSVPQRIVFYVVVHLLMIDMASLCSDLEWIAVRHWGLGFVSILVLIPLWKSYSTIYLWLVLDRNPLPFP